MRTCRYDRLRGYEAADERRDLLFRHLERIEGEIETLRTDLVDHLSPKTIILSTPGSGSTA
jgi:hypothetical protein